jgi:hypothetical protein
MRADTIHSHLEGSNTQMFKGNYPKYRYYTIESLFWTPMIIQNGHINTFRTNHDMASLKLIDKQ